MGRATGDGRPYGTVCVDVDFKHTDCIYKVG
jgi:hypothetical protein